MEPFSGRGGLHTHLHWFAEPERGRGWGGGEREKEREREREGRRKLFSRGDSDKKIRGTIGVQDAIRKVVRRR